MDYFGMRAAALDVDDLSWLAPRPTPGKVSLTDRMLARPHAAVASATAAPVQRKAASGDDPFALHLPVQAHASGQLGTVALRAASGGTALPAPVRAKMERAMGADFGAVRVHLDGQAEELGANAFAHGDDLHFASGTYDPDSERGQALIGHELAHVLQQREGRVSGGAGDGAAVVQDAGLEAEADRRGLEAAQFQMADGDVVGDAALEAEADQRGAAAASPRGAIQGHGIVQMNPAGAAAAAATYFGLSAADAAAVGGTLISAATAAAQAGGAIAPGASGVQELTLGSRTSRRDEAELQKIIQVRLINAYVAAWQRAHPEVAGGTSAVSPTTTTTVTTTSPTRRTRSGGTERTTTTTTMTEEGPEAGGAIDEVVRQAVRTQVEQDVQALLDGHRVEVESPEYIWSDSGASTADTLGTVGAIQLTEVRGAGIEYAANLEGEAANIPSLRALPFLGQTLRVRQYRGGYLRQGLSWAVGLNDALAVNVAGGTDAFDEAAQSGHGEVTINTTWNWDGGVTRMRLRYHVAANGTPTFSTEHREGNPDDWNLW
jgi:hypothetical protein